MRWLVRLYPRAWRQRYGSELRALVDDLPRSPAVALDLIRGAGQEHARALADSLAPALRTAGGPPMPTHPLQRHPTAWALAALLVMTPTVAFVSVSFLAYQLELPGMAGTLDPIWAAIGSWRILDLFLLGAPFLALLLAAAPLLAISMSRVDGELRVTLGIRPRRINLGVLAAAILIGCFLVGRVVSEFLLEAP